MPRIKNEDMYQRASMETIMGEAKRICDSERQASRLFDRALEQDIPRFDRQELVLGRVLGRGGFCEAREITSIKLVKGRKSETAKPRKLARGESDSSLPLPNESTREFLARRVWSKSSKYVIKQLNVALIKQDRVEFLRGLVDISLETSFLASLQHNNIIGVVGVSSTCPFQDPNYFIMLEKLKDTLSSRINQWMQIKRTARGITGLVTGGKRKAKSLLVDRLLVAHDIAEGMSYLHSRRIAFRDLKPDNVGFDSEDTVKIFDFGLAKELSESEKVADGLYRMTGLTGAIRYMAPEVGLRQPYGLKADVYSWSMVMWNIMALEPPMGLYTNSMLIDRVFKKGYRPAINEKWPHRVGELMKACWSDNDQERPNFTKIMKVLRKTAQAEDPEIKDFMAESDAVSGTSGFSTRSSSRSRVSSKQE